MQGIGCRVDGSGRRASGSRKGSGKLTRWTGRWTGRLLDGIHAAAKGEPAWPPLLGFWHDLSMSLAEALDGRASFHPVLRVRFAVAVPERTAFVRFRQKLVAEGLDARRFAAVVRQLEAKAWRCGPGHWSTRR